MKIKNFLLLNLLSLIYNLRGAFIIAVFSVKLKRGGKVIVNL
jgi:hypothetical protein